MDRIAAIEEGSQGFDEFLLQLVQGWGELAECDFALLRLQVGEKLESRAAWGLTDDEIARFSVPAEESIALAGLMAHDDARLVKPDELGSVAPLETRQQLALYCLPLSNSERFLGLVYLGFSSATRFPEGFEQLAISLAPRVAASIVRQQGVDILRQAIASRDDVLSVVAHDLRNPISVISLAANSLHQRVNDPSVRRTVERIIRAAQRGDHLIRDLLDASAIEDGRFVIEKRPLETANAILAAIESQQSLAATASMILATDLSPELPSIEGDEERLLEVLENLIGNAVKFTGAGGTVLVGASYRENEVLVWVKDTGQGIPIEHLPFLFDRFWQARKRDRRGTGLGLTICKGIVEAHGGRIWADSAPGEGTTVFFTLPSRGDGVGKVTPALANILLVDDRPENLLSLKAILERPDYRLVTASSGADALRLALREQFSVALIDIAMPGMDGLEVAVHMKELERSRDIPIIFITAFGDDPEEVHRAYAAGGADYLVKPLDAEIVRKKVAVFVDLNRRRIQNGRTTAAVE